MKKLLSLVLLLALAATMFSVGMAEEAYPGGEVTIMRPAAFDTEGFRMLLDQVEEETGVKINIKWDDGSNAADQFVLAITGGEAVDIHVVSATSYATYLENDILYPLDDALAAAGQDILARVNPSLWDWCKGKDGKTYAIPLEQANYITTVTVRQDWLDALGIAAPTTVEEYEAMLRAFKDAYDCAPLMIQLNNTGRHFEAFLGGAFLENGYSWWKSEDGTYLPPEMAPGYTDMLETLARWYADGLINPDSMTIRDSIQALIEHNMVGAVMDSWALAQSKSLNAVDVVDGLKWVDLPALSGTYDNGNLAATSPASYIVVSGNSQNPEGAVKVVNWIAESLENTISSRQGVKGYHWDFANPEQPAPTDWLTGETNPYVNFGVSDETKFVGGAFELFDINNFTERGLYADQNMYMQAAYDFWAVCYSWGYDYYETLDDQLQVNPVTLSCSVEVADCKQALQEKTIAIITGADTLDGWDEWLNGEYMNLGMAKVIEVKNQVYAERLAAE